MFIIRDRSMFTTHGRPVFTTVAESLSPTNHDGLF
jgi:hypothetical protein